MQTSTSSSSNKRGRNKSRSSNDRPSSSYKTRGSSSSYGSENKRQSHFPWKTVIGTTALAGAAGVTWLLLSKNKDKFDEDDDWARDLESGRNKRSSYRKDFEDSDFSEDYGAVL